MSLGLGLCLKTAQGDGPLKLGPPATLADSEFRRPPPEPQTILSKLAYSLSAFLISMYCRTPSAGSPALSR